jgi:hypothetical protein
MPLTTQCPNPACRVVLNLPESAAGKRLKCPKCGTKFQAGAASTRPPSSAPGVADAGHSSTTIQTTVRDHNDLDLPVATGDLREIFDLPLLMDDAPKAPGPRHSTADAVALFQDDQPTRRRPTGAEARARPRRCSCGGVVPAGMSLCGLCGLDLDTGRRPAVEEMLDDAPPPVIREAGPPIGIMFIGAVGSISSLLLAMMSFYKWQFESLQGFQFLGLICLFGLYASIQFLRGRSAKALLVALALGAAIDLVALVILPAYDAMSNPEIQAGDANDPDAIRIQPVSERMNTQKITWGIIILLIDAAAFVYLSTAGIRRHFDRPRFVPGIPPV